MEVLELLWNGLTPYRTGTMVLLVILFLYILKSKTGDFIPRPVKKND